MYSQLKTLKELLDMGAITQEEFDAKKKEILAGKPEGQAKADESRPWVSVSFPGSEESLDNLKNRLIALGNLIKTVGIVVGLLLIVAGFALYSTWQNGPYTDDLAWVGLMISGFGLLAVLLFFALGVYINKPGK